MDTQGLSRYVADPDANCTGFAQPADVAEDASEQAFQVVC